MEVLSDLLKSGQSAFDGSAGGNAAFFSNLGDGTATQITLTHNLGTRDVDVEVYRNSGNFDKVFVHTERPTTDTVSLVFDFAPALNAYRAIVWVPGAAGTSAIADNAVTN